jgi:asparagine synthase (glutamine-hydrolysing)
MGRFLLAIGARPDRARDSWKRIEKSGAMRLAVEREGLQLWSSVDLALWIEPGGKRMILGQIRSRSLGGGDRSADPSAIPSLHERWPSWSKLSETFWGPWLGVEYNHRSLQLQLVRSADIEMPCYYALGSGGIYAASDADLLLASGACTGDIDRAALASALVYPAHRPSSTVLAGITELEPGRVLEWTPGRLRTHALWNPWDFALPPAQIHDLQLATETVRDAVLIAVRGCSAGHQIILGMSGGLDSSIVAAALRATGADWSGVTTVSSEPAGDERYYARCVAEHLQAQLAEVPDNIERIDLQQCHAAHLPRPNSRAFSQSADKSMLEIAAASGAKAYLHGGGGDNVFAMLDSVRPVLDRAIDTSGLAAAQTVRDIARMTGRSVIDVALRAGRLALRRNRDAPRIGNSAFLSQSVLESAEFSNHPWLDIPPGARPGKVLHVSWLIGIQNFLEGHAGQGNLPYRAPLMAQPVVEACLRVPTWMWCTGGRNRAVARLAFEAMLPVQIMTRSAKGTPTSFLYEILEAKRDEVREMLLEGNLASLGCLDRDKVEAALGAVQRLMSGDVLALMRLIDTESWIRARIARQRD